MAERIQLDLVLNGLFLASPCLNEVPPRSGDGNPSCPDKASLPAPLSPGCLSNLAEGPVYSQHHSETDLYPVQTFLAEHFIESVHAHNGVHFSKILVDLDSIA
ncbi:hypothetical protein PGTUg99_035844 [Puccinia graminis f. sp. tritici]|uniref:Uncharacterized protein n=1 Tax=Puccinia graminis f. sp. tritici TaxID=56615 RepID=A0A5B0RNF1_PUCGR|nr:hypothetical protein PGTUg99_035844 [Puccinia graminis f. sp. tritici]